MSRNIKKEREQEAYDVDEYEVILFKKKSCITTQFKSD